ncbi:MAG TPA: 50S ribosomal protein L9 [Thermoanaerobaculia bacterium]|nr:50S ribosomal protein L9 [Thermoanaerobaculia bacterium]
MEVILLKDRRALGKRGEVVEVKPGFARNYLLPQGLALEATPGNLKVFEQQRVRIETEAAREREAAQEVASRIEGTRIVIHKRASDAETLYGSVTATEIADALEEKGISVDKRRIDLEGGIKTIGDHHVLIHLYSEVSAEFVVTVLPEE